MLFLLYLPESSSLSNFREITVSSFNNHYDSIRKLIIGNIVARWRPIPVATSAMICSVRYPNPSYVISDLSKFKMEYEFIKTKSKFQILKIFCF